MPGPGTPGSTTTFNFFPSPPPLASSYSYTKICPIKAHYYSLSPPTPPQPAPPPSPAAPPPPPSAAPLPSASIPPSAALPPAALSLPRVLSPHGRTWHVPPPSCTTASFALSTPPTPSLTQLPPPKLSHVTAWELSYTAPSGLPSPSPLPAFASTYLHLHDSLAPTPTSSDTIPQISSDTLFASTTAACTSLLLPLVECAPTQSSSSCSPQPSASPATSA